MKKTRINIIIVTLLLIVAAYFYLRNKSGTIPHELRDFAVEDTASVDKIFMVNKENEKVLLERNLGYWTVNEKYHARKDAIDLLLKTINRLDIKAPSQAG